MGHVTDEIFLAVLIDGLGAITSTGVTAEAIRADLSRAARSLDLGADSRVFIIMPAVLAAYLAFKSDTTGAAAFPG